MATHSSILAWKIPWTEKLAGFKESDTTVHTHKVRSVVLPSLPSKPFLAHSPGKGKSLAESIGWLWNCCPPGMEGGLASRMSFSQVVNT